jgi:hypothetical protein
MPGSVAAGVAPPVSVEMFQLDDLVADGLHSEIRKAELLGNGYVRVEDTAGLVRLWERLATGDLFRRSGYGECSDERRRVHQMFTNAPAWIV